MLYSGWFLFCNAKLLTRYFGAAIPFDVRHPEKEIGEALNTYWKAAQNIEIRETEIGEGCILPQIYAETNQRRSAPAPP